MKKKKARKKSGKKEYRDWPQNRLIAFLNQTTSLVPAQAHHAERKPC
jgi:hypothetical protein